ncbi:MAG: hypothetical protein R3F14_37450 [Polyangiaceae bacterium]|jgi:hypothetical protein
MAKKRRKKKTATGHAPLLLGSLGLGALEIAARATRYEGKGARPETAWRNATADVLEKVARGEGNDPADALAEAAETIREGGS